MTLQILDDPVRLGNRTYRARAQKRVKNGKLYDPTDKWKILTENGIVLEGCNKFLQKLKSIVKY